LAAPGHDVRLALGDVRDDVVASTGGKQEPYLAGSLGGGIFAIVGGAPKPLATPPPGQLSEVERTWDRVKDTTSIPALEMFRQQYGKQSPLYDRLAEGRIEQLKREQRAKLITITPPTRPEPDKRAKSVEPPIDVKTEKKEKTSSKTPRFLPVPAPVGVPYDCCSSAPVGVPADIGVPSR
jgi:hypothetical protein